MFGVSKLAEAERTKIVNDPRFSQAPDSIKTAVRNEKPLARYDWVQWLADKIWCPYCHTEYPLEEASEELVTYWGGDDIVEVECGECEKSFFVEELVRRTYTSGKTVEEVRGY